MTPDEVQKKAEMSLKGLLRAYQLGKKVGRMNGY